MAKYCSTAKLVTRARPKISRQKLFGRRTRTFKSRAPWRRSLWDVSCAALGAVGCPGASARFSGAAASTVRRA
eukprot:scaffold8044_cov277-Pinguiococcus_pyrenoidosus.AAC.1